MIQLGSFLIGCVVGLAAGVFVATVQIRREVARIEAERMARRARYGKDPGSPEHEVIR